MAGFADKEEAFERFCQARPDLVQRFFAIADEGFSSGRRRWSSDAVTHIVRWSTGSDINDHFTAYLARKYLAERPDRPGFFELRASRADRKPHPQMELGI